MRGFFGKIRLKIGLANTKKVCYALKKLRGLTVGVIAGAAAAFGNYSVRGNYD